jgi:hypothetical protein
VTYHWRSAPPIIRNERKAFERDATKIELTVALILGLPVD